jgi:hypothetical protein
VPISSGIAPCLDIVTPGIALGSKEVTSLQYSPGKCEPMGGTLSGTVEKTDPYTFCCIPSAS